MRSSVTIVAVGCLFAGLLATPTAWADAVSPPPDSCLDGTTPATGHCGPHCEPTTCTTDADCGAAKCVELPLCTSTIVCAGNVAPNADLSQYERQSVSATCADGTCAQGTCTRLRVCSSSAPQEGSAGTGGAMPTNTGTAPTNSAAGSGNSKDGDDGGCALTHPGAPHGWTALLALSLVVGWARRRRE